MCEFLVYFGLGYVSKHYVDRPEELKVLVGKAAKGTFTLIKIIKDNFIIEIR